MSYRFAPPPYASPSSLDGDLWLDEDEGEYSGMPFSCRTEEFLSAPCALAISACRKARRAVQSAPFCWQGGSGGSGIPFAAAIAICDWKFCISKVRSAARADRSSYSAWYGLTRRRSESETSDTCLLLSVTGLA